MFFTAQAFIARKVAASIQTAAVFSETNMGPCVPKYYLESLEGSTLQFFYDIYYKCKCKIPEKDEDIIVHKTVPVITHAVSRNGLLSQTLLADTFYDYDTS